MKKLLITCPPGIEDIVKLELEELFGKINVTLKPYGIQGRVLADLPENCLSKVLLMRSIHHVIMFLDSFKIDFCKGSKLNGIYEGIRKIDLSNYLCPNKTFRVTTERIGMHDFTSMDVQRIAGQAIVDKYGNKVDLKNYDVEVRVDIINEYCIVGIAITKESLHKRNYRIFNHPAALNPAIAYAMVRLSNPKPNEVLVDPMLGGGTILIEAAYYTCGKVKLYGFDINERYIEGAKANAKAAGVESLINFSKGNCKRLSQLINGINKIITNPPYGVRMEPKEGIKKLYSTFTKEAYKAMEPNGRLVIITLKRKTMENSLLKAGFSIKHERQVLHGDIRTHIIVAVK